MLINSALPGIGLRGRVDSASGLVPGGHAETPLRREKCQSWQGW